MKVMKRFNKFLKGEIDLSGKKVSIKDPSFQEISYEDLKNDA